MLQALLVILQHEAKTIETQPLVRLVYVNRLKSRKGKYIERTDHL